MISEGACSSRYQLKSNYRQYIKIQYVANNSGGENEITRSCQLPLKGVNIEISKKKHGKWYCMETNKSKKKMINLTLIISTTPYM